MQILFVEDNEQDVYLVLQAAKRLGDRVSIDFVSDGKGALEYLAQRGAYETAPTPDLILLDINLPGRSGIDVLEQIKTDPGLEHLAVLMFSTSERDEDIRRSFARGACSYVVKPGDFSELEQVLSEIVEYWSGVSRRAVPS